MTHGVSSLSFARVLYGWLSEQWPEAVRSIAIAVLLERERPRNFHLDGLSWMQRLVALDLDRREVNPNAFRYIGLVTTPQPSRSFHSLTVAVIIGSGS